MAWSTTVPTEEQISQINQMVEDGLKQGALGIGVRWGVAEARWEVRQGVFIHGRFSSQQPPTSGILGFEEFMANVGIYGGGLRMDRRKTLRFRS